MTIDEPFVQAEEFTISDLDTLKVVADPLRLEIIELIYDHAHTVKQVAHKLSMPPSKLYYHINLLEKHGLISITSTRIVSGIVEKSYQASARNFRVERGLLTSQRDDTSQDAEGVTIFVDAIFDDAKHDIKQNAVNGLIDLSGDENPHCLRIARSTSRLTPGQALEFQSRLRQLIDDFQQHKQSETNTDEQVYAIVMAMYPTSRGTRPDDDDGAEVSFK